MRRIIVPDGLLLTEYLEMEEQFARAMQPGDEEILFTWRVDPTVICGRHQVIENEVNLDFCREKGIRVVQRKSGGGTVYADRGNLMISYISPSTHSEQVFSAYLQMVAGWLQLRGFNAVTTAHNDVLVDGFKVSGTACYALPNATIVHGTLLENVDLEQMARAITPNREKLAKHGVESVRQRVRNLNIELNIP